MGKSDILCINAGGVVSYQGDRYIIKKVLDINSVLISSVENNTLIRALINQLHPDISDIEENTDNKDLSDFSEKEWTNAKKKFEIIKPIIEKGLYGNDVVEIAKQNQIHISSLYRWIKRYNDSGAKLSSLVNERHQGGRGKSRLSKEVEELISVVIDEKYLNKQRISIIKAYREIQEVCYNQRIKPPHFNTFKNRIISIREEDAVLRRYGKNSPKFNFEPIKGHFPDTEFPLSVVQIDHTKLDIILVDELNRAVIGRPWITLAIDVYSRMVVGLYLSYDPPGALGTGMCISHSILAKELYLSKLDIGGEWPCWGVMKKLYLDNAKEFRGQMLERACQEYGISLDWRPVRTPNYGGHIERLLGTFLTEIHDLPGTTFSSPEERELYDSERKASLTINEFEKWLVTYIVSIYHKKKHSALKTSPFKKYNDGVFGNSEQKGCGLPSRMFNERKVKLDFMPFIERTVQEYGIVVDYIFYYHEILRKWVHSRSNKNSRGNSKRKFLFRRDPRDISAIYFFDPELNEYFEIPYRDTSHPPITLWEHKEIIRKLETSGKKDINESEIFDAYKKLKKIEEEAVRKTDKIRILKRSIKKAISQQKSFKNEEQSPKKVEETKIKDQFINLNDIKPFEDIDDGTPFS